MLEVRKRVFINPGVCWRFSAEARNLLCAPSLICQPVLQHFEVEHRQTKEMSVVNQALLKYREGFKPEVHISINTFVHTRQIILHNSFIQSGLKPLESHHAGSFERMTLTFPRSVRVLCSPVL